MNQKSLNQFHDKKNKCSNYFYFFKEYFMDLSKISKIGGAKIKNWYWLL